MNPRYRPFSLVLLVCLLSATPKGNEGSPLCKSVSLPRSVQGRLNNEFSQWRIQEPKTLGRPAYERWQSEKPLKCPGLAPGYYEGGNSRSYAVLLVPAQSAKGYKLLVFSRKTITEPYDMRIVEQSDTGTATNFFIRNVRIDKFLDARFRTTHQIQTADGILLFDAGDNEYEADLFYWATGAYGQRAVDY